METGSRQKNHAYQESEKADRRHIRQTACKFTALAAAAVLAVSGGFASAGMQTESVLAARHSGAKPYAVTSDMLNVRSGPGMDYRVIGTITRGMRVNVYSMRGEKENRWARIRFQGVTAYVSAKYLSPVRKQAG